MNFNKIRSLSQTETFVECDSKKFLNILSFSFFSIHMHLEKVSLSCSINT